MDIGTVPELLDGKRTWVALRGDALERLKELPDDSVDAVVTDPPAGIGFMGREWDLPKGVSNYGFYEGDHFTQAAPRIGAHKGNLKEHFRARDLFVAWMTAIFREVYRVLKPGGHGLVWALPRTSHWTASALEDAGFEVRDRVSHIFGNGFPKSLDLSKAIDKMLGAKREVIGIRPDADKLNREPQEAPGGWETGPRDPHVTAPGSPEAAAWDGWGTALKPAIEDWWLIRKPFRGTLAKNVLAHGTGGLNVDSCRVAIDAVDREVVDKRSGSYSGKRNIYGDDAGRANGDRFTSHVAGRWPPHLVLTHAPDCELRGVKRVKATCHDQTGSPRRTALGQMNDDAWQPAETVITSPADADGLETVEDWSCVEGCPVAEMDAQSRATGMHSAGAAQPPQAKWANQENHIYGQGVGSGPNGARYGDDGGASRFFPSFSVDEAVWLYQPKPSRSERDAGLDSLPKKSAGAVTGRKEGSAGLQNPRAGAGRTSGARNVHPTVKSVHLMRWLCRLITPPGGVVLDPFAGSGSTLVAALREQFRVIGIEQDETYFEILSLRVQEDMPLFNRVAR